MELIRKLDSRRRESGKRIDCFGLFLCSYCKREVERKIANGQANKSCGCVSHKLSGDANRTHGDCTKEVGFSSLYVRWQHMKSRCYNENKCNYKWYGGRGITVCEEWRNSYPKFKEWCLQNEYKEGLEIDRINNDGNYEPSNCRFVSHTDNMRNSSATKLTMEKAIEIREKYKTKKYFMRELAKEYSAGLSTIAHIIYNESWK